MLDGMSVVGLNGFDCEMASGASVAGIKKLRDKGVIKKDDKVVGILTGRQKEPLLQSIIITILQINLQGRQRFRLRLEKINFT